MAEQSNTCKSLVRMEGFEPTLPVREPDPKSVSGSSLDHLEACFPAQNDSLPALNGASASCDSYKNGYSRRRGDGRVFLRGRTFWVQYYVNGEKRRESAKTSSREVAEDFLRLRLESPDLNGVAVRKVLQSSVFAEALTTARREERERCAKVLEARSAEWLPLSVVTARHYELAARVIRALDGAQ